jgi:hypothetical protein
VKVLRFSAEKKGKYVYNASFLFCLWPQSLLLCKPH